METSGVEAEKKATGPARVDVPPPGYQPAGKTTAPGYGPAGAAPVGTPASERERVPGAVKAFSGCLVVFALLSVLCGIVGAFVATLAANSRTATATESATVAFTGTPTLAISASLGSIYVVPSQDGALRYTLQKSARGVTQAQADQAIRTFGVTARQEGDVVTIAETRRDANFASVLLDRHITLTVEAPRQTAVNVTMTAGTLELRDLTLTGDSTISGTAGAVTLTGVTVQRALTIRMTSGTADVQCALGDGARLDGQVTAGSLMVGLPADTRAHLEAHASAGDVTITGWPAMQVSRHGANVTASGDLNPNPTSQVTLGASSGAVKLYAR